MTKDEFEQAIRYSLGAKKKSGAKWKQLEAVFARAGTRGSGVLHTRVADRKTRVRQLFTAKRHAGHEEEEDFPQHGVMVNAGEAADLQRNEDGPDAPTELAGTFIESTLIPAIKSQKYPTLPFKSVLVVRYDPPAGHVVELDEEADGDENDAAEAEQHPDDGDAKQAANAEQRDEEVPGSLVPLALLVWGEDEITTSYLDWYPDVPVVRIGRARPEIKLAAGALTSPSSAQRPLVGLDTPFNMAVAALRAGKHVILYGPPGTGKTELAEYLCKVLIASPANAFDFASATSDWSTFDTIGGYLPVPRKAGVGSGEVAPSLDFHAGVITRSLDAGRWLVIDELNRADIDKAFGELFTLLSGKSVRLPFKKWDSGALVDVVLGESGIAGTYGIPVPRNWRMIGTMNTFDKASLYQLSFAFMRRFAFISVPVPARSEYHALLASEVEAANTLRTLDDAVKTDLVKRLIRLVSAENDQADLRTIGLPIGPAIPLDIVRYCDAGIGDERTIEAVRSLLLQGVESLLYPQFEGSDRRHAEILSVVVEALDLSSEQAARTESVLRIWTGQEPEDAGESA